jgi:exo-beta-1,3-glucanase (GH17 family)
VHPFASRPDGVLENVQSLRRVLRARRDNARVIVTEVGWATSGAGLRKSPLRASEKQQARFLKRSFRLLIRNRKSLRLDKIFWHHWRDESGPGRTYWTLRMGLLRSNGTPKPSLAAFTTVAGK